MFQEEVQVLYSTGIKNPTIKKEVAGLPPLFLNAFMIHASAVQLGAVSCLILFHSGEINNVRRNGKCIPVVIRSEFIYRASKFSFRYYIESFFI